MSELNDDILNIANALIKKLRNESCGWVSDHALDAAHAIELLIARVVSQKIILDSLSARGKMFRQHLINHFDDGNHIIISRKRCGDDYTVIDAGAAIAAAIRLADVRE